jgi:hypothetical protein
LDPRVPGTSQIAVSLVVGDDENDVWFLHVLPLSVKRPSSVPGA